MIRCATKLVESIVAVEGARAGVRARSKVIHAVQSQYITRATSHLC